VKRDADGARLEALGKHLDSGLLEQLAATRPQTPDANEERAFIADLLRQLGDAPTGQALHASLPYLGRALRCYEEAAKLDSDEEAAWLIDDLLQALGWAADAQDVAAGEMVRWAYQAAQESDRDFGLFLGPEKPARHPRLIGPGESGRAFRWHRWARAVCERDYLSRAAKQLAPLLALFADGRTGECWPPRSVLVELSGMSTKGVREGMRELEADLALVVEKPAKGRGSTRYRLLSGELTPLAVEAARYADETETPVPF
jgi:hypothetical protein